MDHLDLPDGQQIEFTMRRAHSPRTKTVQGVYSRHKPVTGVHSKIANYEVRSSQEKDQLSRLHDSNQDMLGSSTMSMRRDLENMQKAE